VENDDNQREDQRSQSERRVTSTPNNRPHRHPYPLLRRRVSYLLLPLLRLRRLWGSPQPSCSAHHPSRNQMDFASA
jgi:hypothetical protein